MHLLQDTGSLNTTTSLILYNTFYTLFLLYKIIPQDKIFILQELSNGFTTPLLLFRSPDDVLAMSRDNYLVIGKIPLQKHFFWEQ